jgi:hypothetical protein
MACAIGCCWTIAGKILYAEDSDTVLPSAGAFKLCVWLCALLENPDVVGVDTAGRNSEVIAGPVLEYIRVTLAIVMIIKASQVCEIATYYGDHRDSLCPGDPAASSELALKLLQALWFIDERIIWPTAKLGRKNEKNKNRRLMVLYPGKLTRSQSSFLLGPGFGGAL